MYTTQSAQNKEMLLRVTIPIKYQQILLVASEEKIFDNRPIRIKHCLWRPCFSSNWHAMRNFVEGLPYIIPVKFGSIWPSGFRGEDENSYHVLIDPWWFSPVARLSRTILLIANLLLTLCQSCVTIP